MKKIIRKVKKLLRKAKSLIREMEKRISFRKLVNGYYHATTTFLPSVLNFAPFACTTVMVICPDLLRLISFTVPVLPLWVPATALHWSPSFNCSTVLILIFVN